MSQNAQAGSKLHSQPYWSELCKLELSGDGLNYVDIEC